MPYVKLRTMQSGLKGHCRQERRVVATATAFAIVWNYLATAAVAEAHDLRRVAFSFCVFLCCGSGQSGLTARRFVVIEESIHEK